MKVYRITRTVNRYTGTSLRVGSTSSKVVTKRALRATLRAERECGGQPAMTTFRVEEAEVSSFTDVTAHWLRLCGTGDYE